MIITGKVIGISMTKHKAKPYASVLLNTTPSPDGSSGTTWARLRYHAQVIADVHNLHIRDLLGTGREQHIVKARAKLYKYARDMGLSYPRIGRIFGRDHTTILHAMNEHFPDMIISRRKSSVNQAIDIHKGASYNAPLMEEDTGVGE